MIYIRRILESDIAVNKVLMGNQIKIKKRQILKFIRNYPLILVLGPACVGLIVFYVSKYIVHYKGLLTKDILIPSIALIISIYGFLSRKKLLRFDQAHLLYLNDKELTGLLIFELFNKIGFYIVIILLLYAIFDFRLADMGLVFLVLVYQDILGLYSYNLKDKKLANIFRISLFLLLTFLYFNSNLILRVLFIILAELIILVYKFNIEDIDKNQLFKELKIHNNIQSAVRNKDYSKMDAINKQNIARKGRAYSFFTKPNYENIIIQQALLRLRRTSSRIMIGLSLGAYILLLVNKFYLGKDFINVFLIYIYLTNINTLVTENFKILLKKESQGLFLDAEYKDLVKSYFIINFVINTIFLLGASIIFKNIYYILVGLLYGPMVLASIYFSKDNKKIITYINSLYLLAILLVFKILVCLVYFRIYF